MTNQQACPANSSNPYEAELSIELPTEGEVIEACRSARLDGKRLVFTHGAFDLLHVGHVVFLERALAFGDVLVVGVHIDKHIAEAKGAGRPIFPLMHRVKLLSSLNIVSFVVVCRSRTAEEIIVRLHPDIYVKDTKYDVMSMPESEIVRGYGGAVQVLPYTHGISTTAIVQAICESRRSH